MELTDQYSDDFSTSSSFDNDEQDVPAPPIGRRVQVTQVGEYHTDSEDDESESSYAKSNDSKDELG